VKKLYICLGAARDKLILGAAEIREVQSVIAGFKWFSTAKQIRIKSSPKLEKLVVDLGSYRPDEIKRHYSLTSEILKLFGEFELYSLVNMKYLTNDEMFVIYGHCNCEAILLSKEFLVKSSAMYSGI
jgi:hypothetical protein